METTIFYFSATGNSLNLSRQMARDLGNCNISPISQLINNDTITITTPRIGIIFPVYAWGMPRIVEEFIHKLSFKDKPYIFAIATCVAIQGNTLNDLKSILRHKGVDLNAGFAVKSGRSSLINKNWLDDVIIKLDQQRLKIKTFEERKSEIMKDVKHLNIHRPETSSWGANIFGSLFHGIAIKTFKTIDTHFIVEESCTGCGNCAIICPRSNIIIENGRPVFQHNCELCHACIQWCPNFAIKHPNFDPSLSQYHNPEIQLTDIIKPSL